MSDNTTITIMTVVAMVLLGLVGLMSIMISKKEKPKSNLKTIIGEKTNDGLDAWGNCRKHRWGMWRKTGIYFQERNCTHCGFTQSEPF